MSIILLVDCGTKDFLIAVPLGESTLTQHSLEYSHTNVTWLYVELPNLTWKII